MSFQNYKIEKVNDHLYRIIGITNEFAYLVIGNDRALLIDTCSGVDNIRKVISSLTNLPYDVCISHGHVDHVGGAGRFKDKRIYLNKKDWNSARIQSKTFFIKQYTKSMARLTHIDVKTSDYKYTNNHSLVFEELKDGQIFDLGGIRAEAIAFPGHTKGMMSFLLLEDKILLVGDACNPSTFLFFNNSLSISEYRRSIISFCEKVEGKFNRIILSHLPKECNTNLFSQMISIIDDLLNGKKAEQTMRILVKPIKVAKKINPSTGFTSDYGANLFFRKVK